MMGEKLPDHVLSQRLCDASAAIEDSLGRWFYHVKTAKLYRRVKVSLRESDLVPLLTYRARARPCLTWTRPVSEVLDGRFVRCVTDPMPKAPAKHV